jgi:glycosyltransferase involved in cell wall biosynthesis
MKLIEVINVDFSLRHFVLPLMRAARAAGHEVIGACADGPLLAPIRAEGFRVVALPPLRSLSPVALATGFRTLHDLFRAERPDIVHAHMPISGFVGRAAARAARVPCVAYTCHGFLFNQPGPLPRRAASFLLEFLGGRMTDIFLTVSTEEAADARRLRIARHAVPVLNGRDPHRFRPDPEARARLRAELGAADDTVVVAIVSRLVRHKGHAELAAALAALPADLNVALWVVGDRLATDRGQDVVAALRDAGLGDRLRLLGYRDDIPAVLAAADIFALPSHFEGLPMSVIEAMLCGLPVVATDIRGPREQVVAGETGLLVAPRAVQPLSQALRSLIMQPALRARMGAAGRQRALDLFNEDRVLAHTLDLLGLSGHGAPA